MRKSTANIDDKVFVKVEEFITLRFKHTPNKISNRDELHNLIQLDHSSDFLAFLIIRFTFEGNFKLICPSNKIIKWIIPKPI